MERRRARALAVLNASVANMAGVSIWDPFPLLCRRATCSGFLHGKPLYFDAHHLSGYGNDLLFPAFNAALLRSEQAVPKVVAALR